MSPHGTPRFSKHLEGLTSVRVCGHVLGASLLPGSRLILRSRSHHKSSAGAHQLGGITGADSPSYLRRSVGSGLRAPRHVSAGLSVGLSPCRVCHRAPSPSDTPQPPAPSWAAQDTDSQGMCLSVALVACLGWRRMWGREAPPNLSGSPPWGRGLCPARSGGTRVGALTSLVLDRVIHGAPTVCQALSGSGDVADSKAA